MTTGADAPPGARFYDEIMILVRDATGEDDAWRATIGPGTRLDGDLLMDSVEMTALSHRLHDAYGVDLLAFLAALDVDQIIALTVADVADFVATHRALLGDA